MYYVLAAIDTVGDESARLWEYCISVKASTVPRYTISKIRWIVLEIRQDILNLKSLFGRLDPQYVLYCTSTLCKRSGEDHTVLTL